LKCAGGYLLGGAARRFLRVPCPTAPLLPSSSAVRSGSSWRAVSRAAGSAPAVHRAQGVAPPTGAVVKGKRPTPTLPAVPGVLSVLTAARAARPAGRVRAALQVTAEAGPVVPTIVRAAAPAPPAPACASRGRARPTAARVATCARAARLGRPALAEGVSAPTQGSPTWVRPAPLTST
jgi:hypothetical protein